MSGESELRDLVSQTLENSGVLSKIRAELRASVFLVLEEHEAFKGRNISLTNKPLKEFLMTQEGLLIINLIREFLEFFGLGFTANVFEPETQAGKDYEYIGRNKLAHDLKLNSGKKSPLIAQVLQESKVVFSAAALAHRDEVMDISVRKDKMKEEKLGPAFQKDLSIPHANGLIKGPESLLRDADSKPHLLAHSPPSLQNYMKKPDSLKLDLNQMNLKPASTSLSSLGGLPPLGLPQPVQTSKTVNNKSAKQVSSDIKALLDFGSGTDSPENNYEEDFHQSGSEKTSKGTNRSLSGSGSEIEEDMSAGMDDHMTDLSGSNGSSKAMGDL